MTSLGLESTRVVDWPRSHAFCIAWAGFVVWKEGNINKWSSSIGMEEGRSGSIVMGVAVVKNGDWQGRQR